MTAGVIRGPRRKGQANDTNEEEAAISEAVEYVRPHEKYLRLAYTLK